MQKIILILFTLIIFSSCRKDIMEPQEPTIPDPPMVEEIYVVNLEGQVVDERNRAIQDATVTFDGQVYTTDEFGFFNIDDINASSVGTFIKVQKEGFFSSGTKIYTRSISDQKVKIQLVEFEYNRTFDASNGVLFETPDGVSIGIPANGISRNGNPYNGQVTMQTTWLDPSDVNEMLQMPGDLSAFDLDMNMVTLASYGMVAVELLDDQGNELQLSEGTNADLTFPVPASLLADAPASIPLWHFDEDSGYWLEESNAMLINDTYRGSVSHFSWWNCDIPFDFTIICVEFLNENNVGYGGLQFALQSQGLGYAYGYTNEGGVYCDIAPKNTTLDVYLKSECDDLIQIGTITTTSADTSSFTIVVPPLPEIDFVTLTGQLTNCDGEPVTNGYALFSTNTETYLDYTDEQGIYEIEFVVCTNTLISFKVTAVDIDGLQQAEDLVIPVVGAETVYNSMVVCDEPIESNAIIYDENGEQLFLDACQARLTGAELLITATSSTDSGVNLILGVTGYTESTGNGTFPANIISNQTSGWNLGQENSGTVSITSFQNVGGKVVGSFAEGGVSGEFIADRIQ